MKSMKIKFAILVLMMGILAACASPATEAPASQPTEAAASVTEAPTQAPAATEASAVDEYATEAPTTQPAAGGATVSFANDVLPLLDGRCSSCHGGNRTEEGLSIRSYTELMAGSEGGPVIVPGDASNSLLIQLVSEGKMPKRGPKLTPDQVQMISDWVNQGALDN